MTDHITLPRAVADEVRDLLCHADFTHFHFAAKRREMLLRAETALAALDAALAEPDATREPATDKEIDAEWLKIKPVLYPMYGLGDFRDGFHAAERFHGITKENKS